jgi:hypothetical protein
LDAVYRIFGSATGRGEKPSIHQTASQARHRSGAVPFRAKYENAWIRDDLVNKTSRAVRGWSPCRRCGTMWRSGPTGSAEPTRACCTHFSRDSAAIYDLVPIMSILQSALCPTQRLGCNSRRRFVRLAQFCRLAKAHRVWQASSLTGRKPSALRILTT